MLPGSTIDRFVVEAELGRGGLAVVYRVRHRTLGTHHALKVLTVTQRSVVDRLVQEGVLQARLAHPNIVAVTDVLDVEGAPGLLMEHVDGGTLADLLDRGAPPLDEALRLFRGVLAAVEHAHAQGVIHRDLKPANVLLAPSPAGPVPKVADFGLAKVLHGETRALDSGPRAATRAGVAMGTPNYMAPEQVRDAATVDARADVFALGCVLYELATGRMAFEGPDVLTIYNRTATGSFPPIDALGLALPRAVTDTIRAALQVDPAHRPQSCAALRAILDGGDAAADILHAAYGAQQPPDWARPAPPANPPPPPAPVPVRDNHLAWILTLGLVMVGLGGLGGVAAVVFALSPSAPVRNEPDPPPETIVEGRRVIPMVPIEPPVGVTPSLAAGAQRPLPTCDRLIRCMAALQQERGPLGDMFGSSAPGVTEGVRTLARMDGISGMDAEAKCDEMWRAYQPSFKLIRQSDPRATVPEACRP